MRGFQFYDVALTPSEIAQEMGLGVAAGGGAWWGALDLIAAGAAVAAAIVAWRWPEARPLPRVLGVPAYLVWGAVAGLHAWGNVLRGEVHPVWDPTRRGPVPR